MPVLDQLLIGFNLFGRQLNMAYQFADGFDNYGNSYTMVAGYPWDFANNSASVTSTSDYRFTPPGTLPGGCVVISNNGNVLRKNLSTSFSTLIVGFGIKFPALPSSSPCDFVDFWDSGNNQCSLAITNTGAIQFYRSNGASLGGSFAPLTTTLGSASSAGVITAGAWYGVALEVTVATGTAGSITVYLNGSATPALNVSGVNSAGDGTSSANQVSIGVPGINSFSAKYDDFYCFDTTGSFLNAPLGGDARILTKMPTSAGTYTNWTPNGLANNYQNAAVQPPSTLDYNANNVGGTQDSYTMQVASLAVSPYFVVARASLERDDAGTHTPSIFVRSGSTNSAGVVTSALTSSYLFYDALFQNDPNTGVTWTGSSVDAAQAGIIEG
jgi:hypothetical protein